MTSQELERSFEPGNNVVNPKSFGITARTTRVYRKLQHIGDNKSAMVSIPIAWTQFCKDSKLCGYVRMTLDPDTGSILLEQV